MLHVPSLSHITVHLSIVISGKSPQVVWMLDLPKWQTRVYYNGEWKQERETK